MICGRMLMAEVAEVWRDFVKFAGGRLMADYHEAFIPYLQSPEGVKPEVRGCDFYRCMVVTQRGLFINGRADPARSALIKIGSAVSPERE